MFDHLEFEMLCLADESYGLEMYVLTNYLSLDFDKIFTCTWDRIFL